MARIVIRGAGSRLRRAMSFTVSGSFHGAVLAWVAFSSAVLEPPARSLYDQAIRGNEHKIIWYRLADKLPEISPPEEKADPRPLRARDKARQTMVSGKVDLPKSEPMIWTPEPVPTPNPTPLPNVVAVAPPKLVRPFVPPPEEAPKLTAPKLPDAPRVEAKVEAAPLPLDVKGAKPAPRAFVPPPEVRMARQAALPLPEAPEARTMVVEAGALPFAPAGARPRGRDFVPPPESRPTNGSVALALAPDVNTRVASVNPLALPKGFVAPPTRPIDRTAPSITDESPAIHVPPTTSADTTLAIVGLNPANTKEVPRPPESRPAGFSAGPETRKDGAATNGSGLTLLNVPGLTVRNGPRDDKPTLVSPPFSPTSRENLLAAARTVGGAGTVVRSPESPRRTVEAPDPRLAGRVVYAIAIQMPNVTSYSGSWQVWFAEREPLPNMPQVDMRAPVPLRKVDPKYVAAAAAERIEGIIRLAAVIRKDGHVESISLIRHLDDRLDRTAQEALAKWEFDPALRNGVAVDVDAVFEIPFRLAPKPGK